MTAFTQTEPTDKKPKKLSHSQQQDLIPKINQIIAEHDQKLLKYFDENLLKVIAQLRAVAIAAGVTPEKLWEKFVSEREQDEFYIRLHAQEDLYNMAAKTKAEQDEILKNFQNDWKPNDDEEATKSENGTK